MSWAPKKQHGGEFSRFSFFFCFINFTLVAEQTSHTEMPMDTDEKSPKQNLFPLAKGPGNRIWQDRKHLDNNHSATVKQYRKHYDPQGRP